MIDLDYAKQMFHLEQKLEKINKLIGKDIQVLHTDDFLYYVIIGKSEVIKEKAIKRAKKIKELLDNWLINLIVGKYHLCVVVHIIKTLIVKDNVKTKRVIVIVNVISLKTG